MAAEGHCESRSLFADGTRQSRARGVLLPAGSYRLMPYPPFLIIPFWAMAIKLGTPKEGVWYEPAGRVWDVLTAQIPNLEGSKAQRAELLFVDFGT